ncbi:histidine kinase-like protein [Stackebrandtia albiflava]|uniref:Histidine kinase-like protein n=1 Tax=Stackebrandtia albiflava TaxID=406432 RepID=A0A562V2E4_9ACTN|nr:ATP-binding protein [Stackebrandtia albiflava]TWJ12044.1 histidine kinase-like protein [Stackebrandtia albiflava]
MPVVRFGFTPAPVHVRTARLVAASVAQRAPLPNELLSEVRQAAGEACSRAVARHRRFGVRELVRMELTIGASFVAEVADFAPVTRNTLRTSAVEAEELTGKTTDEDTLTEEVALALLGGLVTDLQVIEGRDGVGSVVRMAWPL